RGHAPTSPSEHRIQLCHSRSVIGRPRRGYLAHPMGRATYAGSASGPRELIAEVGRAHRPSILTDDEVQVATRTRRERRREHGENWQRHDDVSLLGHELNLAIANVLSAETGRVTDTKPTVKQHVEPDALPGADRPSPLIGRDVALAPGPKSGS